MNTPPKMISAKDLMYIGDILNVLQTDIKKFEIYKNNTNDNEIKSLIENNNKTLFSIYNNLLGVLKSEQ